MWRPLLAAAAAAWVVVRAEDAHCHWRSYAARYDDVRAAFGTDEHALREHYFSYGRSEGRTCHDEMEPFDFVQEHWVEIEAPLNGETFAPDSIIETTARVHQSTVPAYGNATHVSLSILVANIERTFFLRRGAALSGVDAFCGEHPPLETQNCAKLKTTLESLVAQLQENAPPVVLCFVVSDGTTSTERCDANPHSSFSVPKPGRYTIAVRAQGALGSAARGPRSARSVVSVNVGCPGPTIVKPRHGAIVSREIEVELEEEACVSINGVEKCGSLLSFADLPPGRVAIRASTGDCLTTISVDVRSPIRDYERPLLVTAASERYVQRRMLDNLVGSLHFWEPSSTIVVYDLGFSPASRSKVLRWRDVELRDLAPAVQRVLNETPPHTLQASSYAFKMIVVQDALRTARSVLWIDANCEARRPLDDVFHLLRDKGHFLVEHPYRFPTTQFHHPAAVSQLGCVTEDFSRQHCATTFVGVVQGSWFATDVLPRLVACMRDSECVNPIGSSRDNHRQEQTALNAILCALQAPPDDVCLASKSFRMTADFENDLDDMQPTRDETAWNGMYLYTRRDHAIKPYLRFLRAEAPVALEL